MKKLLLASLAVLAMGAQAAGSTNYGFSATVNFTQDCRSITYPGPASLDFGSYTAFTSGPTTPSPKFTRGVECTRNTTLVPVVTASTIAGSTVAGLQYTLSAAAAAGSPGTPASGSSIGSGDVINIEITGAMPGSQAGDFTATTTDGPRTLTITW